MEVIYGTIRFRMSRERRRQEDKEEEEEGGKRIREIINYCVMHVKNDFVCASVFVLLISAAYRPQFVIHYYVLLGFLSIAGCAIVWALAYVQRNRDSSAELIIISFEMQPTFKPRVTTRAEYDAYVALIDHAFDALGPELGRSWLDTSHPEFEDMTPLDFGEKYGYDHPSLEGFLVRFEHGVFY
jgi:hypothetical protein